MDMIEVHELVKRYCGGRVCGVDGMSFTVREGEIFGLIGQNGAGKSTTIRILMDLIRRDSGIARIGGLDCAKGSREIKRFTAYMPTEVRCYPAARVGELLDYACRLRGLDKRCWHPLAERFALDPTKRFRELSVGNRRKLSIVQALMGAPRLMILDEPTGGLDPLMQDAFFSALLDARRGGATVFFSSHNLSDVQRLCDRVALVRGGRVQSMPDLKGLRMRAVELPFCEGCEALLAAVGAQQVRREGTRVSFMVAEDDMQALLSALAQAGLSDVTIARPSLEQMFMGAYAGEEHAHDAI